MPRALMQPNDIRRALTAANFFNIAAGQPVKDRCAAVFDQAVDFVNGLAGDISTGVAIGVGSIHGTDLFLSRDAGQDIARREDPILEVTGYAGVEISDHAGQGLETIRETFGLADDRQAASLAVRVYVSTIENLWRGNSFTICHGGDEEKPLPLPHLQAEVIRARMAGRDFR